VVDNQIVNDRRGAKIMADETRKIEDLNRSEPQELPAEAAEAAEGGIIAILIGLTKQSAPTPTFQGGCSAGGDDIITGGGPGAPGGHV
jgi:hypothetical protein